MTRAKLFMLRQAVRLAAEFRFEGDENRNSTRFRRGYRCFQSQSRLDWVRTLDLPSDLLSERNQPEDDLRDQLPRRNLRP
jgi:hypothetical protein